MRAELMDTIITKMINNAYSALKNSYSPYSKFRVASCICTDKNTLYTGVNVENGSYSLTLCAEACAVGNMIASGDSLIKKIVILAGNEQLCPPCGACRQRIHEFSDPETMIYLCNKSGILKTISIDELLPLAFDLNPDRNAL
jgi:cytidine deaminase